jgi:hypothetical protein
VAGNGVPRSAPSTVGVETAVALSNSADTGRPYWRRVARLARERWQPYVVFCAALWALEVLRRSTLVPLFDDLFWVLRMLVSGSLVFLGLIMSEALALKGVRHALASLAFVSLAVVAGVGLLMAFSAVDQPRDLVEAGLLTSEATFVGRFIWFHVASGMLLVAYFAMREREAAIAKAARAAELDRAHAERTAMASRLKVMQARVEPELLFGVLADVRSLYERDRVAAEALLDDLIAYLRAALPQMRGAASTLAREAALAEAYLKVVPAGPDGRVTTVVHIDQSLRDLEFPPMVLLPLAHDAAESGATRIAITATIDWSAFAPQAVVEIEAVPKARWEDARIHDLRRVAQMYLGATAFLVVEPRRGAMFACLQFAATRNDEIRVA